MVWDVSATAKIFIVTGVFVGVISGVGVSYEYFYSQGLQAQANESFQEGFEEGNQTGFEQGFEQGVDSGPKLVHLNPGDEVHDLRGFQIDGYNFDLRKIEDDPHLEKAVSGEETVAGYTWMNGSIVIQSGLDVSTFERVCTHEILHNKYPDRTHPEDNDWFEEKQDTNKFEACQKLLTVVQTDDPYLEVKFN